jgi:hypothetical protein
MDFVIVVADVMHVHGLGHTLEIVNVAREAPERRIIHDAADIAFEVAVIHGIEPHQRGE